MYKHKVLTGVTTAPRKQPCEMHQKQLLYHFWKLSSGTKTFPKVSVRTGTLQVEPWPRACFLKLYKASDFVENSFWKFTTWHWHKRVWWQISCGSSDEVSRKFCFAFLQVESLMICIHFIVTRWPRATICVSRAAFVGMACGMICSTSQDVTFMATRQW